MLAVPIYLLQKAQAKADVKSASSSGHGERQWSLLSKGAVILGLGFIYLPILLVIVFSFNESRLVTVWSGFSLKWYGLLFDNAQLLSSAWLSLKLAVISASAATILGVLAALTLVRGRAMRWARLVRLYGTSTHHHP